MSILFCSVYFKLDSLDKGDIFNLIAQKRVERKHWDCTKSEIKTKCSYSQFSFGTKIFSLRQGGIKRSDEELSENLPGLIILISSQV